jgi:acyl-CoA reductase-like NAD-dependent aldehyde dehydrogenase
MAQPTAQTDRDLTSIAEARSLARRAREAAPALAELSQSQIDAIVGAMAAAVTPQAEALARLAFEETGFGVVADNRMIIDVYPKFAQPLRNHLGIRVCDISEQQLGAY